MKSAKPVALSIPGGVRPVHGCRLTPNIAVRGILPGVDGTASADVANAGPFGFALSLEEDSRPVCSVSCRKTVVLGMKAAVGLDSSARRDLIGANSSPAVRPRLSEMHGCRRCLGNRHTRVL